MYRALKSFCGRVTMRRGEEKAISDPIIVKDLLRAGYIEEIKPANSKPNTEEKTEAKTEEKPKKKKSK